MAAPFYCFRLRMTLIQVNAESALSLPGPEGFAKEGDNQHSLGLHNVQTTTTSQGHGNNAAYLAARLKKAGKDDLLEQVKAGEIRSIRAAAIEAGIIKPVPTVRLVDDLNKVAASITKHLTNDQPIVVAANNALIPVVVSVRCAANPTCLPDSMR